MLHIHSMLIKHPSEILLMFITFMVNAGDCPLELGQLLKHRPAEGHWLFWNMDANSEDMIESDTT